MRRFIPESGRLVEGVSRLQFLGGAAAILAGCSAQRMTPTVVAPAGSAGSGITAASKASSSQSSLNLTPDQIPRAIKRRKTGVIVSTNAANTAVATHSSSGVFLGSLALGTKFLQGRTAGGHVVTLPTNFQPDLSGKPTILSSGHAVRFSRHATSGKLMMRVQNGPGARDFNVTPGTFVFEHNGTLTALQGAGKRKKPLANSLPVPKISTQSDLQAFIGQKVDRPGGWSGDDAFLSQEASLPTITGLATAAPKPAKLGASALESCSSTASDPLGTSETYWQYNSTSFGASGSYGSYGSGGVVRLASAGRSPLYDLGECIHIGFGILGTLVGLYVSVDALGLTCFSPVGALTLGVSCLVNLYLIAVGIDALIGQVTDYRNHGCPTS